MIKRLCILAAFLPLLIACNEQGSEYDISRFGAKADGTTVNTSAIQKAIDACHQNGGGKVIVPPGQFVTGTIILKSNVNLHLGQGATLLGSTDTADYWIGEAKHGMIYSYQARGISITGEGVIDGRGTRFHIPDRAHLGQDFIRSESRQGELYLLPDPPAADGPIGYDARPGMMIVLLQCEDVAVRGVTIRDSPEWTMRIADCDDVIVSGISIHNNLMVPNSDGIHCTTSRNVRISDCDIRAGDDAIIVTGFGTNVGVSGDVDSELDYTTRSMGNLTGYSENIVVNNCLLQSRSSGIRVGYGSHSIRNCVFSDLVIYDSNRGIGVFSRDEGSIENILFSNITISNRLHSGHWWGNGEPIHVSAINQAEGIPAGPVKNVRFRNIIAESENGILIYGTEESKISNLILENVSLRISAGEHSESYGGNFDLRPVYPTELGIFKHDIPAVYSQFTEDLNIIDLSVEWGDKLPEYMTHAIECREHKNLVIRNFTGSAARPELKDLELDDWKNADLQNITHK